MCFYCDRNVKGQPEGWWWFNYVCWTCRVQNGVKKPSGINAENDKGGRICYRCHNLMTEVGFKFRTPKKNDVKQWKRLEQTWENQYKYINGEKKYVGPKERVVQQSF